MQTLTEAASAIKSIAKGTSFHIIYMSRSLSLSLYISLSLSLSPL